MFGVDAAEHGRGEAVKPDDNVNLQVINLGLSRTGTTSMGAALEILGFGPCHEGIVCPPFYSVLKLPTNCVLGYLSLSRTP